MADPKIKYDIEANVSGNAEVGQLATHIEQLAGTLDGELKTSALASADALRQLAQKDGAIQNFVDLKRETSQAATGLKEAQAAAQKLGIELSAVETPTRAQAGQLQKLRDAVRDAKTEVIANSAALNQARGGLAQYGISTDNLSQSQRNVKTAINAARTEVAAMAPAWQTAAAAASSSAGKQVQATKQIESGLDSLKGQLNSLRNIAVAALGGSYLGGLAKDVADTADTFNNLQARIKLVTGEGALLTSSFSGVSDVALRTNSDLEQTATLFTRIAEAGKSAGLSAADAATQSLALTETINQTVQLSGGSVDSAKASITQLIQGLQSGVLRGEEFNSVMEQSPRLAKAMADGLGVTTGELRKMANTGALTTDVVIGALKSQSDAIKTEFASLPPAVGRAIENLSTSWTLYVGETDKATGASSAAASAISALSNNLSTVAGFLMDAGQAAAAFVALRLAQYFFGVSVAATAATTAVAANAAATAVAGTASTVAAIGVSRFAIAMRSLWAATPLGLLLLVVTNFKDIGTAIGEGAAKLMGFKDRTKELEEAEKKLARATAETAESRRKSADVTQAAIEKQFGLTKAGAASVAEFEKLIKSGDTAAEAVAKIGKDFDLTTAPGIRDAGTVLNKLVVTGKLTAEQFQKAWSDAIKGADLADFEAKARKAFAGTTDGILRLGQVLDATLRESIKRTGLDFDVISGGMGKASRSAINDTEAMITGLGRLKTMGVDTAQALTASIGKGISTADSQKAIEAVRLQIESVRKELGDKVADGLLDQAKTKATELSDALDKVKPGINSVREAMKLLGVTSDKTFQDTAEKSKAAYDAMKESGTSSARELTDGFKKMAADQIAASGEVGSTQRAVTEAVLKSEGAVRGLSVAFDASGRMAVQTQAEAAAAITKTTEVLGSQRDAVDSVTSALERQNAAQERANAAKEKAIELENKRLNIDKEGFTLNTAGQRVTMQGNTQRSVYENAKGQGLTEAQALQISNQFIQNGQQTGAQGANTQAGENWGTELQKAIDKLVLANAGKNAETGTPGSPTTTVNVRITLPNGNISTVPTTQDGASALISALQGAKLSTAGY